MGQITAYTAAKMDTIIDEIIVDANVVGDNLVATKHDATQVNLGNVRGPVGPVGPQGTGNITAINAAFDTLPPPGAWISGVPFLYATNWAAYPDPLHAPFRYRLNQDTVEFDGMIKCVKTIGGSSTLVMSINWPTTAMAAPWTMVSHVVRNQTYPTVMYFASSNGLQLTTYTGQPAFALNDYISFNGVSVPRL